MTDNYKKFSLRWEVVCCAGNCQNKILVGPGGHATPSPYSLSKESIKEGWYFQPRRCLTRSEHVVWAARAIYCPEHAPIWQEYILKIQEWDETQSVRRKMYWTCFQRIWNREPKLELPKPPW